MGSFLASLSVPVKFRRCNHLARMKSLERRRARPPLKTPRHLFCHHQKTHGLSMELTRSMMMILLTQHIETENYFLSVENSAAYCLWS